MGKWTPDPTLLLDAYDNFDIPKSDEKDYIFGLLFQVTPKSSDCIRQLGQYYTNTEVLRLVTLKDKIRGIKGIWHPSPEKWVSIIKNARFVVTDSFHCTVFCILTHRPFISLALNAWGTDWSERIKSLLERVGLNDRFVASYNREDIDRIIKTEIDWKKVDEKVAEWKMEGQSFLEFYCNEAY